MAELVDALVSGTSGESRGGSSPLLGTKASSGHQGFAVEAIVRQTLNSARSLKRLARTPK
jgi:hypothetical protein